MEKTIQEFEECCETTLFDFLAEIDGEDVGNIPDIWNSQKKLLCIYGIFLYIQEIEKLNNFEGLLIPSSIFLDKEKIPLFNFANPITDYGIETYCKCFEEKDNFSKYIYSFGVMSIIILSGTFSCFENEAKGKEIKKEFKIIIKKETSAKFQIFLTQCVSESENNRLKIEIVKKTIEELIKVKKLDEILIQKLKNNIIISLTTLKKINHEIDNKIDNNYSNVEINNKLNEINIKHINEAIQNTEKKENNQKIEEMKENMKNNGNKGNEDIKKGKMENDEINKRKK